jgi:hypothetical protein
MEIVLDSAYVEGMFCGEENMRKSFRIAQNSSHEWWHSHQYSSFIQCDRYRSNETSCHRYDITENTYLALSTDPATKLLKHFNSSRGWEDCLFLIITSPFQAHLSYANELALVSPILLQVGCWLPEEPILWLEDWSSQLHTWPLGRQQGWKLSSVTKG